MKQQNTKLKKFRVYYFIGDFWSGKGERRKSTIIMARTESEAERFFKDQNRYNCNFGWIESLDQINICHLYFFFVV